MSFSSWAFISLLITAFTAGFWWVVWKIEETFGIKTRVELEISERRMWRSHSHKWVEAEFNPEKFKIALAVVFIFTLIGFPLATLIQPIAGFMIIILIIILAFAPLFFIERIGQSINELERSNLRKDFPVTSNNNSLTQKPANVSGEVPSETIGEMVGVSVEFDKSIDELLPNKNKS